MSTVHLPITPIHAVSLTGRQVMATLTPCSTDTSSDRLGSVGRKDVMTSFCAINYFVMMSFPYKKTIVLKLKCVNGSDAYLQVWNNMKS